MDADSWADQLPATSLAGVPSERRGTGTDTVSRPSIDGQGFSRDLDVLRGRGLVAGLEISCHAFTNWASWCSATLNLVQFGWRNPWLYSIRI